MKRRDFLKNVSALALGGAVFNRQSAGQMAASQLDGDSCCQL